MDELPNPITRSEQYLAKIAGAEPTLPTPITREERYLAKIAGEDVDIPPAPITRTEQYLAAIVEGGGGGVEVESLSVTANGTYTAEEGKAYSPVSVAVPNSYVAADEGKVVSNGALVAQTSDSVTENGTVDTTLINSLVVNVPQGGGGEAEEKDVNFIDYDGTILYSYTAQEFAALDALPTNPTHEGLTAQGWNWTLADAKTYVAANGKLIIGQMYITNDGKTHVHIHLEEGRLSPMLGCCPDGTVVVDWGDGSATETLTGTSLSTAKWTSTHNYAQAGDYEITLNVTNGSMALSGSSTSNHYSYLLRHAASADGRNSGYRNAIKRVNIGASTHIGNYAFFYCYSLQSVTIPNSVTSIDNYAFSYCCSLQSVTIPNSVTSIGSNAFATCYSLQSVTIPNSVTSMGSNAFNYCYSLQSVTIPNSLTSIGNSAFNYCYSLQSVTIPNSVTSIGSNAFNYCNNLQSVTIANSVTSIGSSAFNYCYSLQNVTIPNSVTNIDGQAFYSNSSLGAIHFKPLTPPTVSNSSAWGSIPTDCKIYVPTGSLSAYTSASNYPNSSTYTYIEE